MAAEQLPNPLNPADFTVSDSALVQPVDPFDLKACKLDQSFASCTPKILLRKIPVRKPSKEWWCRVHRDPAYSARCRILELKEERSTYLIHPNLWDQTASEPTISNRTIYTAVNRQGLFFLWPLREPRQDGRSDGWQDSEQKAVELAKENWVRVVANMGVGAYDVQTPQENLPEPKWPTESFRDLIKTAFESCLISDIEHPVLKRLLFGG